MKQLTTVLAVVLLSLLVAAFPHDIPHVIDAVAVPEAVIDVTPWVKDHGQTLSVDTPHPTATVDNLPTGSTTVSSVPVLAGPHDLVPTLATNTNVDLDVNTKGANTHFFGISYSPYNADSTCKNDAEVKADIDKLTHYAFVRIYGVDCDQTRKVINAARPHNLRVFAGVYDLQNLHAGLSTIVDAARPDLSILHTISIGNELLNRGANTAQAVTSAVGDARAYLRGLGYNGPVVTVDTFNKLFEHPELCHVSDYCAANCHAFFNANLVPENAGNYISGIARQLSALTGKRTIITESGWPHAGQPNGRAIPSPENHRRAIDSLRRAFGHDNGSNLVLFSAFDDAWKQDNEWTFGAEKYWGIEKR
ncbi:glycoside hydrolase superfamily [Aspergillus cavernicola]|uniref:Glycoside hydrolase superfamily n=1 Tax=Aspergillus cavernicola TaxID=176166 RepID=A0ABR4IMT7_9EURO